MQRYRSHLADRKLSAASINLALAALRKLATEAAAHGGLSPLTAAAILSVGGDQRIPVVAQDGCHLGIVGFERLKKRLAVLREALALSEMEVRNHILTSESEVTTS